MFFVPLAQRVDYKPDYRQMIEGLSHFIQGLLLVTDSPSGDLEPLLRKTLAEADPNLTITSVRSMQQQVDLSFDRERAVAILAETFAFVALLLAAVGVYGVTAFMVARRRNDIGIRMALGASRARVVQLVVGGAFRRAVAGLGVGLLLALGAGRLMVGQLYGVSFWDPFALALGGGSLAACVLVAALIPAGRAAAISPMSALRAE
jgi:ABC-type antimicrobial peptide transport system permease subunit